MHKKISLPRGIFCEVKKCRLLCSIYEPLKWIEILSRFFLTMASRLSVYDVLERLEDDDDGLYSEDESDCEAEGISGYMPEADASGEALDDDDEEGADDASSSALTSLM